MEVGMKKERTAEGKETLRISKAEWEKIGRDAGWAKEQPVEEQPAETETAAEVDLGWTLEKQADMAEEIDQEIWHCKVCTYFGPSIDYGETGGRCPNCGAPPTAVVK